MEKFLFVKKEGSCAELRIGDVWVHAELLRPDEDDVLTFGGGEYYINLEKEELALFGKSTQFGEPRLGQIGSFKIPSGIRFFGKPLTFQGWKVTYKDKDGKVTDLTSLIVE